MRSKYSEYIEAERMNNLAHQKTIIQNVLNGHTDTKEADKEFREMIDWTQWLHKQGVYRTTQHGVN